MAYQIPSLMPILKVLLYQDLLREVTMKSFQDDQSMREWARANAHKRLQEAYEDGTVKGPGQATGDSD